MRKRQNRESRNTPGPGHYELVSDFGKYDAQKLSANKKLIYNTQGPKSKRNLSNNSSYNPQTASPSPGNTNYKKFMGRNDMSAEAKRAQS